MNAAWFAGLKLVESPSHSLPLERYPMGCEATLSYNTIEFGGTVTYPDDSTLALPPSDPSPWDAQVRTADWSGGSGSELGGRPVPS